MRKHAHASETFTIDGGNRTVDLDMLAVRPPNNERGRTRTSTNHVPSRRVHLGCVCSDNVRRRYKRMQRKPAVSIRLRLLSTAADTVQCCRTNADSGDWAPLVIEYGARNRQVAGRVVSGPRVV